MIMTSGTLQRLALSTDDEPLHLFSVLVALLPAQHSMLTRNYELQHACISPTGKWVECRPM